MGHLDKGALIVYSFVSKLANKHWKKWEKMNYPNFGSFIKAKREEKKITLRKMVDLLDVSAPFLSDVEKDRRNPFGLDKLTLVSKILCLTPEDGELMFNLTCCATSF